MAAAPTRKARRPSLRGSLSGRMSIALAGAREIALQLGQRSAKPATFGGTSSRLLHDAQGIDSDVEPTVAKGDVSHFAAVRLEHLGEERLFGLRRFVPEFGGVFPDDLGPGSPQNALKCAVGLHDLPGAVEEHHAVSDGIERGLPLTRRELGGVFGKLAALLYGKPQADLADHCRAALQNRSRNITTARDRR